MNGLIGRFPFGLLGGPPQIQPPGPPLLDLGLGGGGGGLTVNIPTGKPVQKPGHALLGLSSLFSDIANIPAGLASIARALLPGAKQGEPGTGELLKQVGHEAARSFLGTAGLLTGITPVLEGALGEDRFNALVHGWVKGPEETFRRGLLPGILETAGNVATVAAPVAGALGKVGALGEAGAEAGRVAEAAGATGRAVKTAEEAARAATAAEIGGPLGRGYEIATAAKTPLRSLIAPATQLAERSSTLAPLIEAARVKGLYKTGEAAVAADVRGTLAKVRQSALTVNQMMRGQFGKELTPAQRESIISEAVRAHETGLADVTSRIQQAAPGLAEQIRQRYQPGEAVSLGGQAVTSPEQVAERLQTFVPAGQQSTINTLDPVLAERVQGFLAKPDVQTHLAGIGQVKRDLNAANLERYTAGRLGEKGFEPSLTTPQPGAFAEVPVPEPAAVEHPAYREAARGLYQFRNELEKVLPPEIADKYMSDFQLTLPDVLRSWEASGFTPAHFSAMKTSVVDRLARDRLKLAPSGPQQLRELTSPFRRIREELLPPHMVDKTFRSWAAETAGASQEQNWNTIINYLDQHVATPAEQVALDSRKFVAYNPGDKNGFASLLQHGVAGGTEGAPMMIPAPVARSLRRMAQGYDNPFTDVVSKITNPWRSLILTYSPRWHLNNLIGNFMMSSAEIGSVATFKQWRNAYSKFKTETGGLSKLFTDEFERRSVPPEFRMLGAPGEVAAQHPELAGSVLPSTLGEIRGDKGRLRAFASLRDPLYRQEVASRVQRMNEVVDEIARTGVMDELVRRGMLREQALKRAMNALVNYTDLGPFERSIVRAVVPFFGWQKGILKQATRLALDHPIRTRIYSLIGYMNHELWDQEKQSLPEIYQGLIGLSGSTYLNTRGLNPFSDAAALVTPRGIESSINPFLQIIDHWIHRTTPTPFGPKEIGPLGFAQPQVNAPAELGQTLLQAVPLLGGLLQGRGAEQSIGSFIGTPVLPAERVQSLLGRFQQAQQQVERGLPLPPKLAAPKFNLTATPTGGLLGPTLPTNQLGLLPLLRSRGLTQRTQKILGAGLSPVSTGNLIG